MQEPGLDRHEWQSYLEGLDDDLHADPFEALPALADLVERMLVEAGYDVTDAVARDGEEREVVAEYVAGREVAALVEQGNTTISPGDVAQAINGLRAVADWLARERGIG